MHFKNGREAKQGDHVVTRSYAGNIVGGVIFDLNPQATMCNVTVSVLKPGGTYELTCQDVSQMYHAEDAFGAQEALLASVGKVVTEVADKLAAGLDKVAN